MTANAEVLSCWTNHALVLLTVAYAAFGFVAGFALGILWGDKL